MPESPPALRGEKFQPLAFENPNALQWHAATRPVPTSHVVTELNQPKKGAPNKPRTTLQFLRRVALEARLSAEQIREAAKPVPGEPDFPGGELGRDLRTVARLIAAGLRTRVYYVSHGGYDTHANQTGRHANLLQEFGDALLAFLKAMHTQGNLDRVLVMTFSEFGRRVNQNGSNGTDHGTAAPMFLAGRPIKPGLHGTHPDLANLDNGDLKFTTDFRGIYAAVLDNWLRANSRRILGATFPQPAVVTDGR
jgi:uncharacterized protein (DUF1501 family)